MTVSTETLPSKPDQPPREGKQHVVRLIHFNDVYNINVAATEPIGGASRFVTAIREARSSSPVPTLVLFSGDAFSPAPLTNITQGSEIPPVLNACTISVACLGNHELDNGLDVVRERLAETTFPWVLSNVDDSATGNPLLGLPRTHTLCVSDQLKVGFIGLAGLDWVTTLNCIDMNDIVVSGFVEKANELASQLKKKEQCDIVIALTHMRQPDDLILARDAPLVDIVLGGHDHILWKRKVSSGTWAVKSGTDFKNFGTIDVYVEHEGDGLQQQHAEGNKNKNKFHFEEPKFHDVTSAYEPDPYFQSFVEKQLSQLGEGYFDKLGTCTEPLDGRFASIRTRETKLGNLICDAMAAQTGVPIALLNAGSIRSDAIDQPGVINKQTIDTILPFQDEVIIVKYTGQHLLSLLNNSVSQYPLLDGRFLQVAGVRFHFDPLIATGPGDIEKKECVIASSVQCLTDQSQWEPLQLDKTYMIATKTYIHSGKDGFIKGAEEDVVRKAKSTLPTMFIDYLHELAHNENFKLDGDGKVILSPQIEDRIVCLTQHDDLLAYYHIKQI